MADASATTARQAVFPSKGVIELSDIDVPAPGADELLLRVKRVGICATDLHLLEGHIGDPFPLVPGHEFVGEVASIGEGAARDRGLAVGDRIVVEMLLPCGACPRCREGRYNLCDRDDPAGGSPIGREYGINIPRTTAPGLWGGYSEMLVVPANAIVHRLPATIPWDTAALTEPLAVAYRAVGRARLAPGEDVVVIGPGPVGMLIAAAARSAGAGRIIMVGTRDSRLELARRFGVDTTVNSRESADVVADVRAALGGQLADVVIEIAGVAAAQRQAVTLVRRGGRVVLAGACGADVAVEFQADEQLLTREIDILPSFLSAGGYEPSIATLERGAFPFAELVTHRFTLDEVEQALTLVRSKHDDVMKAILVPNE